MKSRTNTSIMTIYAAMLSMITILMTNVLSSIRSDDIVFIYTIYTFVSIFVYFGMFYTSKKCSGEWNSYHIFLFLTFAFYFGGQFLVTFGYFDKLAERMFSVVDNRVPIYAKIEAMNFVLMIMSLINFGYILQTSKCLLVNDFTCKRIPDSLIFQVSFVLFVITIIPTFLSLGRSVILSKTLGHLGYRSEKAAETGIWFLFSYLSGWYRPSCFMMMLSAETKIRKRIPFIGLFIYSVLYLMTGSRYQIIEIAYCLFAIEFIWTQKKIDRKQTFKFLILALFLFTLLKAVGFSRTDTTGVGIFSIEAIKMVFRENIIYELFYTTSTTFTTISNAIMRCPSEVAFNHCKGYIGALLYVLPSFLRPSDMLFFNTDVEQVFSHLYYNWNLSGYGSSFIAEMYYNLGKFSYVLSPIFGFLLAKIVFGLKKTSEMNNSFGFYFLMLLFSEIIWGVRSDLFLIPRHIFLYVFIPWVILKLLSKK